MDHVTSGIAADDVMPCDTFLSLVADTIDQLNAVRPQPDIRFANMSTAESSHVVVRRVVNKMAAPVICLFGIVGNVLNLIVLTRKRLQSNHDCPGQLSLAIPRWLGAMSTGDRYAQKTTESHGQH